MELKQIENLTRDENHVYTLGGEMLTGVTTILKVRSAPFLMWWTVKLMYETLLPKLAEVQGIDEKAWEAILLDAKKAHTRKSKEALVSGGIAHDWIETYVKAKIAGQNTEDMQFPEDQKAASSVHAFLDWEKQHEIRWLYSELMVVSAINKFAGTLDFIAEIDGKITLGDFKTSNQISEDYYLQTAAYQLALEEMGGKVDQRMIIRIPKDGSGFEAQVVPTPLEFDKATFLNCRELHRWNLLVERLKEETKLK